MTPAQEEALIAVALAGLDDALRAAFDQVMQQLKAEVEPREAIRQAMESFRGAMADTMAVALSALLAESVGSASVLQMQVGPMALSARLYALTEETAEVVRGIVERHAQGFQDARALALDLFEGYDFREAGAEPLRVSPRNDKLPRYLREALATDASLAGQIERALARLQVDGLRIQALRAAYRGVLAALTEIEAGTGAEVLTRRIEIAFFERVRFFARRIAETELHRAYSQRQAAELMADEDVEWVQWRMNPSHPRADICDFLAGVNRWGLGPGVYLKARAPVAPAHPFCRCVLAPRLDLTGRQGREVSGADQAFFRGLDLPEAARVAGSRERFGLVMAGADPIAVHNERSSDPLYRIKTVAEAASAMPAALQGVA